MDPATERITMVTKRPLSYWIKTSNLKLQLILLVVIAFNVVARVFPLEMQKRIVNQAIGLKKINLLFIYCGLYLVAVLLASGLKYAINVIQNKIGQETLSRMRKDLYAHILTLPLSFFRKASSGLVVSSLVTEVVSAGELVGQAVAVPVNNLLTLLAFAGYMFFLNPLLAAVSMVIYPIIVFVVPVLQRRSNAANKQRVDATRVFSGKIGETISGIHEIHGNGSYRIENRRYGKLVDELCRIRIVWNMYRFAVKVLNNLFQNLGPFFLFVIGGYLAIHGRFDLGALVAFLSAYEKLSDPWKELMDFYQVYQDASISYVRLMEYFDVEPEHLLEPTGREPYDLKGAIQIKDLSFSVAGGIRLLKNINLELRPGEQLALVGFSGSGKSTLAQCISQLYKYTGGSIQMDGLEVSELTKRDLTCNVGVVAQAPYVFDGTIKENLIYSCEAVIEGDESDDRRALPTLDEMIEVIQQVGLFVDVLRFGLNRVVQTDHEQDLVSKLVRVRENFQAEFGGELGEYVEFFDDKKYLHFSSVAANLTFGSPNREEFSPKRLPRNDYFLALLEEAQLKGPLINLGRELATQTVDILGALPPDEVFFEQSPIPIDEFEEYKELVGRLASSRLHELSEGEQRRLLRLALRFIPGVHKIVALPEMMERMILDGRYLFMEKTQKEDPGAFTFYRMSEYIHSQTILDNILFGKPTTDQVNAQERINQSIIQLLIEEDLLERIVEIGMEFNVGTKGDRLSGGQRQKLAIARVFLKNPHILIMDEATSALDNASQKRIQTLLETKWKGKSTLISVIHRLDTIKGYDQIGVMKAGKIVEMGTYDALMARKGMLYELVHGPKSVA
jgi:ABC-type multidrug transport system fused ATPase/permease subunit